MTAKKPTKAKKKPASKKSSRTKVTSDNVREAQSKNQLIERKGISIWDPAAMVATVLSVGRIPYAPGTWGSLMALPIFPLLALSPLYVNQQLPNINIVLPFIVALLVLLYCIGIMAVKSYQTKTKTSDAPEIVYDEFFGQIFTYVLAYAGFFYAIGDDVFKAADKTHSLIYEFVPFLFFRLFDICKPWPINLVDRMENSAWGVMFDDVLAACYAAAASVVVFMMLNNYI